MTTPPTLPLPAVPAAPRSSLFAPPEPRRRVGQVLAAAGAVVALVGGLAVHAAAGPSGPSGFRTAVVGTSNVDQTLEGVGTVEPLTQAAVAFPVAGKVASVDVAVGDGVNVGQRLATLDGAALQSAIDAQQAAVAQAQLVLANARDGVSSGGGTSSGRGGASSGGGGGSAGSSASGPDDSELARAQQGVLSGQQTVDADLQSAQQALGSASGICAASGTPTSGPGSRTTGPTTTTTALGDAPDGSVTGAAGSGTTTTVPSAPDPAAIAACQTALQAVLDVQRQVMDAQGALGEAAASYDQLLDQRAAALIASSAQKGQTTGSGSGTGSGGGSAGGASTVTSADLIKDQGAVDAANARLAVAQQSLKQATIVSPIAGTVASVGLAVGQAVTAASPTATIVIVGGGGFEVTMTVSVDRLPGVALAQSATIRPDGGGPAVKGQVVTIGAPVTSTTGATTYPVSIGLPTGTTALRNGSVASVSIVTKAASHALVVPTAAVHTAGSVHSVNIVSGTTTKAVRVGVGAIGPTWTEITSGLQAGQKVVLADLEAPLPTSATQVSTTRTGGTGLGGLRVPGGVGGAGGGTGRRNATPGG